MPDQSWTSHVIQWGTWFVVMSLIMGGLSRSRLRTPSNGSQVVLTYPRGLFVLGVASSILFLALALLCLLYVEKPIAFMPFWVFLGFAGLG